MSDQTNYINSYIEIAVDTTHNYLNEILQLKTQLKIVNDLASQKDQVISQLREDLIVNKQNESDLQLSKNQAKNWEEKYHAMVSKTSHMDTLTTQYTQLKNDYINQSKEVESLKKQVEDLKKRKSTLIKKEINTKDFKSSTVSNANVSVIKVETKPEIDDF